MAPLPAARAFAWLKSSDSALATRFARSVYRSHWGEGRDMSTPAALAEVGATLGIDARELIAALRDESVKQRLRAEVDASVRRGVFGCPTFIVDGEMFWGADRLDQVDEWLATDGW
jgi:2-hydroxychromene-2-carboxylate isomerase